MRKIEEIEEQIRTLSREAFAELRDWFLEQDWKAWDAQIEAHAKSGKLGRLVSDAKADYESGRTRKLVRSEPTCRTESCGSESVLTASTTE